VRFPDCGVSSKIRDISVRVALTKLVGRNHTEVAVSVKERPLLLRTVGEEAQIVGNTVEADYSILLNQRERDAVEWDQTVLADTIVACILGLTALALGASKTRV
jgi:hypothetical protein